MSDGRSNAAAERFHAIRAGLSDLTDPAAKQLFLDVTTAILSAIAEAARAGRGMVFAPLWHDPPPD